LSIKSLQKCMMILALLAAPSAYAQQWSLGYWTAWAPNPISDLEWGGVTHIAFVGVEPQSNGSLTYSDSNFAADAANMIATAHAHNVKVLIDIWTGPGDFNGAITNNLSGFVANIMNVVNTYGFDGVDLDWESNFNQSNNTQLISALRAQLGTRLLNEDADANLYAYWGTVQQYLDRVSVGTYDLGGTFNPYSWFNSPLHSSDNNVWSWDLVKSRMTGAGVPVGKLNMGIPFFGQIFSAGSPVITGPRQTWGSVLPSIGEIKYTALVGSYNISTPNRDSTAMVPWIGYSNGWISFDDAASITAKVSYAQSNNLGGWIIWALDQDYFPNQTPMHPLMTAIKNAMGGGSTAATPPLIATTALPAATAGVVYSQTLTASGTTPITWSLTGGALPPGLSLVSSTGVISGTPSSTGIFSFGVQAQNTAGANSATFNLSVNPGSPGSFLSNYYLSDLNWTSATIGWGSVQKDLSVGGNVLTLNGTTYRKGIGTHAISQIVYNIAGCSVLQSDIGVDDEAGANGTITFQVLADGLQLFQSSVLNGSSATQHVNVSVDGHSQLTLIVGSGGDGIDYDHADWANASLSCSSAPSSAATPPIITTTSLPSAHVRTAYSDTLTASGTAPITWAVTSGSLPPGLSLSSSGAISGTPSSTGTYSFTVQAQAAGGASSATFSIWVSHR
jgi:GH18 family chitinase